MAWETPTRAHCSAAFTNAPAAGADIYCIFNVDRTRLSSHGAAVPTSATLHPAHRASRIHTETRLDRTQIVLVVSSCLWPSHRWRRRVRRSYLGGLPVLHVTRGCIRVSVSASRQEMAGLCASTGGENCENGREQHKGTCLGVAGAVIVARVEALHDWFQVGARSSARTCHSDNDSEGACLPRRWRVGGDS